MYSATDLVGLDSCLLNLMTSGSSLLEKDYSPYSWPLWPFVLDAAISSSSSFLCFLPRDKIDR